MSWTLCDLALARRNAPRTNRAVPTCRYEGLPIVVEAHVCDEVTMASILLNPSRRLRAIELNLVLSSRCTCDMFIVKRGRHIKHSLIQT